MLIGLTLFSNSKELFCNCAYIFDVSNDPPLYIKKNERKVIIFSQNMLKTF